MWTRLKVVNFRKHRELELHFQPGMVAIRGDNEAGKSTLSEAATYVMFGAVTALRDPIENVVTYGQKASSLKAELDQVIDGVVYKAKRSKAGAEVWLDGGLQPLVTGQDECTRFFEKLYGCSRKVATKLMLTGQKDQAGMLEGGASAPIALIEQLANFDLIDVIVRLVMEHVENGQTGVHEARIASLSKELETPVDEGNLAALQAEAAKADAAGVAVSAALRVAQEACEAHSRFAQQARAAQEAFSAAQATVERAEATVQMCEKSVRFLAPPTPPDLNRLAELRSKAGERKAWSRAQKAWTALQGLPVSDEWDEGQAALDSAVQAARAELVALTDKINTLNVRIAQVAGKVVNDTTCGLCGKDLYDVPEVVARNSQYLEELRDLQSELGTLTARKATDQSYHDELFAVQKAGHRADLILGPCAEFVKLDRQYVPARWTWTGPDVASEPADHGPEIAQIEAAQRAFDMAQGRKEAATRALDAARKDLTEADAQAKALAGPALLAVPVLAEAERLATVYAVADADFDAAQERVRQARQALSLAEAVVTERLKARKRLESDLADAQAYLVRVHKGNALLKKLRAARPQLATKLWSMVLGAVSTYFSQARGWPSVVTREDNAFKVDGQPITGLSGSAMDMLGLAIRIALTKTFLPGVRWMSLDEPASACSAGREMNLLGLLAAADFDQVILVTHSDLSDSVAQQVITL